MRLWPMSLRLTTCIGADSATKHRFLYLITTPIDKTILIKYFLLFYLNQAHEKNPLRKQPSPVPGGSGAKPAHCRSALELGAGVRCGAHQRQAARHLPRKHAQHSGEPQSVAGLDGARGRRCTGDGQQHRQRRGQ